VKFTIKLPLESVVTVDALVPPVHVIDIVAPPKPVPFSDKLPFMI